MATLQDARRNREFPLHGRLTTIGRDPGCDIVSDSPMISARHVVILHTQGHYSVEDLDSMNGTFINGRKLIGRRQLVSGDRIDLVGLSLVFQDCEAAAAPIAAAGTIHGAPGLSDGGTICLSDLLAAQPVPERSSLEIDGDLRLSVKPEAKLRAVLEIARSLSNSLDLKIVLPQILESLFGIFPQADCGVILLRNPQTGEMKPAALKYRGQQTSSELPISRGIIQQVLVSGRAILSHDAGSDARFDVTASIRHLDIRSMMCVPINREGGTCMGVIQLHSCDRASQFSEEDLALLVCTSLLAGRAVNVARLHEERRELEAATQIQRSLLPAERPSYKGLQFFDYYAPAQHVSGDYFDYIPLPGNRIALTIGDVAGKGMAAALLMAHLASATRVCLSDTLLIADAVRRLNALLMRSDFDDRFITFAVAVLDTEQFVLTVVNAGHPPPLLRRAADGLVEQLAAEVAGLPLGIRDRPYQQIETVLHPGDTLLLYTDGVSEMRNPDGKLYGIDRLYSTLQAAPADAEAMGNALLDDLRLFAQTRMAGDDLTLLCLGREVCE